MKRLAILLIALVLFSSIAGAGVLVEIEPFNTGEGLVITLGVIGVCGIAVGGVYGITTGCLFLGNAFSLWHSMN